MRWFPDPEIVILASPEEFVFRDRTDEVRIAPVLWLDAARDRIQAVGDRHDVDGALMRVEVFRPQPTDPDVPRMRLLTMLLRYGLTGIVCKSVFKVKPNVRFGPLAAFDPMLSGFQRDLFQRAALEAGAKRVRFDSA